MALAMSGATTIVAAMATDAWETVRDRVSTLLHRRGPEPRAAIEARLESSAELVSRGRDADRAREMVRGQWQLELEEFLAAHPEAVEELQEQLDSMRAALPEAQQQWVQNNTANGHGVVTALQHGTQHVYYMDSPGPRTGTGTGTGTEERTG
ncbi:hypothetical protein Kpho02_18980 [Kitasatospora phosalacinea]|uniref:Uncharacterized protein n=2 Tax=Kitasatospora phosalacinea TaxID=2065 RepID=A0A9W6Q488_9ACTN|nr:hypothetical protein Kpho02_18980 [Kitasatospora phosalacinea]